MWAYMDAEKRLGRRSKYTYMFKTLLKGGFLLAGSSDAPVEPFNPWLSIQVAASRDHESLTLNDALSIYVLGGRVALLEEYTYLCEGAPADIQVYSIDPIKYSVKSLDKLKPQIVIVGGNVVYRSGEIEKEK